MTDRAFILLYEACFCQLLNLFSYPTIICTMGKHVPPIRLGGMKYLKFIGIDSPIEILTFTNLFMT